MKRRIVLVLLLVALLPLLAGKRTTLWRLSIDSDAGGRSLDPALLGHYDLSGALFGYDAVPGLRAAAAEAGIVGSDWRVGLGRWEAGTELLPRLTDGTPCPLPTPDAAAGVDEATLLTGRDWFVDDGFPVTLSDTQDDARYSLGYARSVLDVAAAFGARPFVSVDSMPRALAVNATPQRSDCLWSFSNRVSNVRPASPAVFAAALIGALERLRLGSDGEPGRAFTHVELWNEPELAIFWDPAFEDGAGPLDRFFEMAVTTLAALDTWRAASPHPEIQALRFGLGSFAAAATAATAVTEFDGMQLPGGGGIPVDFISFHAYSDDPLRVVDAIRTVRAAAATSAHYEHLELVLAEWGPDLATRASDPEYAASLAPALHAATVIAEGVRAGLDRAHRAILWDFYPDELVTLGMIDHAGRPKPLQRAYVLLARAIAGSTALEVSGGPGPSRGSVLATRDAAGTHRVLLVNRDSRRHRARIEIDGRKLRPSAVFVLTSEHREIERIRPREKLRLPPRSIVLAEYR